MSDKKKNADSNTQNELKDSVHKIFLAGLGALATAEEEGSKLFKNLVERGETYESRGKDAWEGVKGKVDEARQKAKEQAGTTYEKVEGQIDDAVAGALGRMGVPSRTEIATLTKRVEELTALVEKMSSKSAKAAS
jgi:poly(hydroxyalkanoate) granule-associated protein